jgi:hypothetical protein
MALLATKCFAVIQGDGNENLRPDVHQLLTLAAHPDRRTAVQPVCALHLCPTTEPDGGQIFWRNNICYGGFMVASPSPIPANAGYSRHVELRYSVPMARLVAFGYGYIYNAAMS